MVNNNLNLTDQQKIRIGTCAWSFEEWRGSFYPPDLPPSAMARILRALFPRGRNRFHFLQRPGGEHGPALGRNDRPRISFRLQASARDHA